MTSKSAIVFGATGLIGSHLTSLLEQDENYYEIKLFVRHPLQDKGRSEAILTDFNHLENYKEQLKADVVYCCLGTTIRKAGSQKVFRKVDYEMVVKIAEIAKANGVKHFIVISSIGADAHSKNFYLRTKGEMEESIKSLHFERLGILRPSLLMGSRKEFRFGESLGKIFMGLFSFVFIGKIRKYKPIKAYTVARAMVQIANKKYSETIFESNRIQELGKE